MTASSSAPLNPTRAPPAKDYSAAFGALQSTYGSSGFAPSPAPRRAAPTSAPARTQPTARAAPEKPAKDFEAAFGALSSSYGVSGAPCLPKKAPGAGAEKTKSGFVARVFSKNAK
ncbi:hypothetical protein HWV62_39870 [Athelia sp. TMB]|nr:hypothetical protein HWV62_39870 [Athelia sp. TMB]